MGMTISSLDDLFFPITSASFFDEIYEKRALHIPAQNAARHGLLSLSDLTQAFRRGPLSDVVCFPEHAETTREALVESSTDLEKYLNDGHPLVWNRAHGASSAVDELTGLLAETFGAHVWPNVYSTGTAGTPFQMHFDAHEVIAVHCEGEKEWTISSVRVDRPLDTSEMEDAVKTALVARREEAEQNVAMTFTSRPGDVVYIPRGLFHNARSLNGRSLHVTFGLELPTGFELAKRIIANMLGDPWMREYLPALAADEAGEKTVLLLGELADRLRSGVSPAQLAKASIEIRERWVTMGRLK
ncbi:MAG: cupin-like domain-containing protein [Polyangiaceae bacterium]|nr:cupin-like domain-containing protein [Polyangiaceae bacterium]